MTFITRSIAGASLLGQVTLYALLALTPALFLGHL
jgi:hypothetical protein